MLVLTDIQHPASSIYIIIVYLSIKIITLTLSSPSRRISRPEKKGAYYACRTHHHFRHHFARRRTIARLFDELGREGAYGAPTRTTRRGCNRRRLSHRV